MNVAEIFKFFNSAPGDERWHYASDFADYFGNVLSSGLLHKDGVPNLQVKVNPGTMQTYVEAGEALIQGYQYENTQPLFLTHGLPEPNLDRIDRIVLKLDKRNNARYIRLFLKEGVPAVNPVAPELQRDNYVYEISLAQIKLTKNTSSLEPLKLVDERMYEDLCGIVHSLVSVPTSVFQQQWDVWFNSKKQTLGEDMGVWMVEQKKLFDAWFATIQDMLEGDIAVNLANQIIALQSQVTEHLAEKNQPNGYAGLDSKGKVSLEQLPKISSEAWERIADVTLTTDTVQVDFIDIPADFKCLKIIGSAKPLCVSVVLNNNEKPFPTYYLPNGNSSSDKGINLGSNNYADNKILFELLIEQNVNLSNTRSFSVNQSVVNNQFFVSPVLWGSGARIADMSFINSITIKTYNTAFPLLRSGSSFTLWGCK